MIVRIHVAIIALFCLTSTSAFCQKYTNFDSKFIIVEKVKGDSIRSTIIKGQLAFNAEDNSVKYTTDFPKHGEWVFKDTSVLVQHKDTTYQVARGNELNANTLFDKILNSGLKDFDLKAFGFNVQNIEKKDDAIFIEWMPNDQVKNFISNAITKIRKNDLLAVSFYDSENELLNTTYFDDYTTIKNVRVPQTITSQINTTEKTLYKSISFKNVEIY